MKLAGEFIIDRKHKIIDLWEEEVIKKIPVSGETDSMVLRNLLPYLLEDIGKFLVASAAGDQNSKQDTLNEVLKKSGDHGRHRAASSHYTMKQMINEYIELNGVLTEKLRSEGLYDIETGIIITYILENSIAHSAGAFSEAIAEMQEKLVGTLTHDVRNPLSAAYMGINMIKYSDGEELFNKIQSMCKTSLRRSMDLLEGLLDAITVKAGEGITLSFSEGDIVSEVKRVHEEANAIYSNHINLRCETDEIFAIYDGSALSRTLENLLSNAVKYGARDEAITLYVEEQGENVMIKVHNWGNPVSEDDKEPIFNFLSRSENDSSGELKSWGMGLTFVKMAIEAHGGHVELESDEENGTTFTLLMQKYANEPGKVKTKLNFSGPKYNY